MIVRNTGYLKLDHLVEMIKKGEHFTIYLTHKNTAILIKSNNTIDKTDDFYQPKYDRLPWKITEGKRICTATQIFYSRIDKLENIDLSKWNNKNQIMSYEEFTINS